MSAHDLTVTLPGLPPSVNARYRRGAAGGLHLTPETAAWQLGAAAAFRAAAHVAGWDVPPKTPLTVAVLLTTPRLFARDLDNALKGLLDAAAAGVQFDDRYLVDVHIRKEHGAAEQTRVTLAPALTPQAVIAARMETYPRPVEGELAFREACAAAKISPIPAHPTGLGAEQAAAVLALLPPGGRRVWPHEGQV